MRALAPALAAGIVAVAAAAPAQQTADIVGPARVVDGDTLALGPFLVRLHGIDAPEARQRCPTETGGDWDCGAAAAARLAALIGERPVVCAVAALDDRGRPLGACAAGETDLNAALVAEGLAWAFAKYSDAYLEAEAGARKLGLGVWRVETTPPWDFRAAAWTDAAQTAPEGCAIKGNISRAGERIYHAPWSRDYARTVIDAEKGERWFCDEAEAQAAGWRASGG
jgi:endonuclease YncB( thermonuclease family)